MFMVPTVPTFRVWMGFASYWGGDAGDAKWRTSRTSPSTSTRSLTFAWRNSKSGFSTRALTLSLEPVMKLSSASTRRPRASRASQRCEPMKPAPPETTARSCLLVAANTSICEAVAAHDHRVVDVAPIHDHRPAHRSLQAPHVEMAKLVPLRDHDQRVCARGQTICVLRVLDRRQLDARALHRRRVVGAHMRAGGKQDPGDVQARRLSEVVGVGLEGQAEQPDDFLVELLEAVTQLVDHEHPLVTVDVHDCVEQLGVIVETLSERRQRLDIFRKTRAAPANADVEVARPDALVEPHALGHELRVGVDALAD